MAVCCEFVQGGQKSGTFGFSWRDFTNLQRVRMRVICAAWPPVQIEKYLVKLVMNPMVGLFCILAWKYVFSRIWKTSSKNRESILGYNFVRV